MRFTIERIRTLVLVAGVLLLAALAGFLWVGKWKSLLNRRDLPQRLGVNIQQEANGYTFVHAFGAHSQYKIHASKEVELKDNRILLHDVEIELYGQDGTDIDRIAGDTFEYDQKSGVATAQGPVEMLLTRPAAAPAATGKGKNSPDAGAGALSSDSREDQWIDLRPEQRHGDDSAARGLFHDEGIRKRHGRPVRLAERLPDARAGGGTERRTGAAMRCEIHAQHAEFDRGAQLCLLRAATADYRGGQAGAAQAKILFRDDGSVARLDATGGFTLATATGGHLASPVGWMDFDEHNQPRHGHMEGGVTMDSANAVRTVHGTSPTAELEFTAAGPVAPRAPGARRGDRQPGNEPEANQAASQEANAQAAPLHLSRTWRSPVADVDFRRRRPGTSGAGGYPRHGRRGDHQRKPARQWSCCALEDDCR